MDLYFYSCFFFQILILLETSIYPALQARGMPLISEDWLLFGYLFVLTGFNLAVYLGVLRHYRHMQKQVPKRTHRHVSPIG